MAALIMAPRLMAVGGGALSDLPSMMGRLGLARPLIVTDPYIAGCGILDRATALLDDAQYPMGRVQGHGARPDHRRARRRRRADAARATTTASSRSAAAARSTPPRACRCSTPMAAGCATTRCRTRSRLPGPPVIAIPTTAGTGSEVTRFTVITDTETDEKMLIAGLACCPAAAIVDYELTLTMPLRLTADTGIDSLTHAIEAYVSRRANPFADGLAKNAMGLIARHIRTACAEPDNRAAREAMMLGATTAGMAFSNASVALVHGMSRPIGAFFHVPHGLSNAMLLPEITAFSAPAALDRYADCARAMGVADESEGSQSAVARLVDELRRLNADLQVPSPRQYGIDRARYEELLPVMASQALASGSPANNPRVPTRRRDHRAVPAGVR